MKKSIRLIFYIGLFIFFNALILLQFYYLRFHNLFTLNLLFFGFLIMLNRYLDHRTDFSNISVKLLVAIITILVVDIVAELIPQEEIKRIGKNLILRDFAEIDKYSGAGYKLRDGFYELDVEVFRNESLVSSYKSEYTIKNSQRVMKKSSLLECKDILLMGGSHNFGQSIIDEHTLQFALNSKGYSTANISAPGYGFANNVAILQELNVKSDELRRCSPKFIIYRFISDHINRDNAKTSFSPYGVHVKIDDLNSVSLERNFTDLMSGLSYLLTKYIPTRIFWYGSNRDSELSFQLISRQLQRLWFYTDDDIKRSAYLIGDFDKLWKNYPTRPSIIVLIEHEHTIRNDVIEKYINYLKTFKNINIILPSDLQHFSSWAEKKCLDLPYNSAYIPFEGHPTGCLNRFYSEIIPKRLMMLE